MKTRINPSSNYLMVRLVEIKDLTILNGLVPGEEKKDVIAKIGYIETTGGNCDMPAGSRMVIFNVKLGTKIKEDDNSIAYLIHKSAVIAYIPGGTISITRLDDETGFKIIEVDVNESNYGLELDDLISKFGKVYSE